MGDRARTKRGNQLTATYAVTFPEGLHKLSVGVPVQGQTPQPSEGERGTGEEGIGRGSGSGQLSSHQVSTRPQHRRICSTMGGRSNRVIA